MDELTRRRLAHNEAVFRRVNDEIDRLPREDADYVCECADSACTTTIRLDGDEYTRIRAVPNWYVVLPGHERPELEHVVERHDGYVVVAKDVTVAA